MSGVARTTPPPSGPGRRQGLLATLAGAADRARAAARRAGAVRVVSVLRLAVNEELAKVWRMEAMEEKEAQAAERASR